jgi:hypothetical protein
MKQFIVAIFRCVAFSTLVNAARRMIAYSRGERQKLGWSAARD